jgi:hypothetical protein
MTRSLVTLAAIATALAGTASITSQAEARRGKDYFSQTYQFSQPMKGVEGQQGNYYCSYRNTPIFKEVNGKRVKVGYELFQHCY